MQVWVRTAAQSPLVSLGAAVHLCPGTETGGGGVVDSEVQVSALSEVPARKLLDGCSVLVWCSCCYSLGTAAGLSSKQISGELCFQTVAAGVCDVQKGNRRVRRRNSVLVSKKGTGV